MIHHFGLLDYLFMKLKMVLEGSLKALSPFSLSKV